MLLISMIFISIVATPHYDRYYLLTIPLFTPFVLFSLNNLRFAREGIVLSILIFGLWSWYGTYEYFSWNTTRWQGIKYLLDNGAKNYEIDGGFEYNFLMFGDKLDIKHFGCALDRKYIISLNQGYITSGNVKYPTPCKEKIEGNYTSIKSFDYYGPFGEKLGTIYALKRI